MSPKRIGLLRISEYAHIPNTVSTNHTCCVLDKGSPKNRKLAHTRITSFTTPSTKHHNVDVIVINCATSTFSANARKQFRKIIP